MSNAQAIHGFWVRTIGYKIPGLRILAGIGDNPLQFRCVVAILGDRSEKIAVDRPKRPTFHLS